MGDRVKKEKLDAEWIEIMKVAKQEGFTKNEVKAFIRRLSINTTEHKAKNIYT